MRICRCYVWHSIRLFRCSFLAVPRECFCGTFKPVSLLKSSIGNKKKTKAGMALIPSLSSFPLLCSTLNKSAHDGAVTCGIWIYDGEILVTGSRDANLKAWQLRPNNTTTTNTATSSSKSSGTDEGGMLRCLETAHGHKAPVLCFAMCASTNVLASGKKRGREEEKKKRENNV